MQLFQSDLFSQSRPGWVELDPVALSSLNKVLSFLPPSFLPLRVLPEQSDALGINSSNFRLTTSNGMYVLKRWSKQVTSHGVENILAIMTWLESKQMPVPGPAKFKDGKLLLFLNSRMWSLFPYVAGEYFSGSDAQLRFAAGMSGQLTEVLSGLPLTDWPGRGPAHMTEADRALLSEIEGVSNQWDKLFGGEYANLLNECWTNVINEWTRISRSPPHAGPLQVVHFDLHPHNLLVKSSKVVAVLDFEACKVMPVGYAVGFAALKQCRQTMVGSNRSEAPAKLGQHYVEHLTNAYPDARIFSRHLGDLAVCESLRRICVILRLNLEDDNQDWNKILPVQIAHLAEARALFG